LGFGFGAIWSPSYGELYLVWNEAVGYAIKPTMRDVVLLTCKHKPEPDEDEEILLGALGAQGLRAEVWAWDDSATRKRLTQSACLVVVRSTWNYYLDLAAFQAFLEEANQLCVLANSLGVLRWNTDKIYLRALRERGLSVTPTVFLASGDSPAEACKKAGFDDAILKPRVSAGSHHTYRLQGGIPRKGTHDVDLAKLTAENPMMLQPFVKSVESHGERSVICIEGTPSHSMRKSVRLAGSAESATVATLGDQERTFAQTTLALAADILGLSDPDALLYARVDFALDDNGAPMLMELELTEPSLFLRHDAKALNKFASAIRKRAE
jgi:glutathione synthase/RimK-type ligase-like ATP-grasp enzyme